MTARFVRFTVGAVVAVLLAGALIAPFGSPQSAAAQSDAVCAPTKGQPRLSDLVVAGQTPDGIGVSVKNIGCYATTTFFQVRVTVTDGNSFASEYISVTQLLQPGAQVIIPVGFDCELYLARIDVDINNSLFELNENNNTGNATSTIC